MTIAIKITNTDSRAEAIVAVKVQSTEFERASGGEDVTKLKGGEEVEKYVHSGQRLVVEEVKNG